MGGTHMNIRDIAAAAHVSVATVSKIMNHKDSEISDKTRQKVLKVIKEYQYTPYANLKATLNSGKSQMIALIAQEELLPAAFIFELEKEFARLGYSMMICTLSAPHSDSLQKYMKIMESRHVEGILLALHTPGLLDEAAAGNYTSVPMAAVTSFPSSACTVFCRNYKALTEQAVSKLIELGHQKIGCIVDETDFMRAKACIEGYQSSLAPLSQYGANYYIARHSSSRHELLEEIQSMLQTKVTAFFCQTTLLANAVYEILKERKYYIPNSISVICGEADPSSRYFIPALSSFAFSDREIISQAAEYLIHCIESRSPAYTKTYTFQPVFHPGESIAPPISVGKQILVAGNCNIDINIHLDRLPEGGELLKTSNITTIPGGKAVAQAIGAGKLEGTVYILGCVGNDAEGSSIVNSLRESYVHTDGLTVLSSLPTGKAYLLIPDTGNSTVISYPGTTAAYSVSHVKPFQYLLETSDYCLLSTELNETLVSYLIRQCERYETKIFLKPTAIDHFPEELLPKIHCFIPSSYELDNILPGSQNYAEKAELLFQKGCRNIIVTLGGDGCYLKNEQYSLHIPAANFNVVDTTGAANCFIAALGVSLSKGSSLLYAVCYATYAAGISVTQPGVQTSFPDKRQLDMYLDDIQDLYQSLV